MHHSIRHILSSSIVQVQSEYYMLASIIYRLSLDKKNTIISSVIITNYHQQFSYFKLLSNESAGNVLSMSDCFAQPRLA